MICSDCARGDHGKCRSCPCRHKSELRVDMAKLKHPAAAVSEAAEAEAAASVEAAERG